MIATSTPELKRIKEDKESREAKKNKSKKQLKFPVPEKKTKRTRHQPWQHECDTESDDDPPEKNLCSDHSSDELNDTDSDGDHHDGEGRSDQQLQSVDLKPHDFLIARYATKKTIRDYVGQLTCKNAADDEYQIKFMKREKSRIGKKNAFFFPEEDDVNVLPFSSIIAKLPKPHSQGGTKRVSLKYIFNYDFDIYKI